MDATTCKMAESTVGKQKFLSAALAAYPPDLNKLLVSLLCSPISSVPPAVAETLTAPDDAWERRAGKEKVEFKQPLRGKVDADI